MTAKVLAGYLDSEELQNVFKQLARAGAILILEGLTDLQMRLMEAPDVEALGIDPTAYEEGRMFDGEFELHWQLLRGYPAHVPPFRAMLICDDAEQLEKVDPGLWQASSGKFAEALPLHHAGGGSFFLWGEAVRDADGAPTGEWYEKEVPRMFRYPVDDAGTAQRVKLVTKSYELPQQGNSDFNDEGEIVLLHRFAAIVPAQE